MTTRAPQFPGAPVVRREARDKVTGTARYAADRAPAGCLYAWTIPPPSRPDASPPYGPSTPSPYPASTPSSPTTTRPDSRSPTTRSSRCFRTTGSRTTAGRSPS